MLHITVQNAQNILDLLFTGIENCLGKMRIFTDGTKTENGTVAAFCFYKHHEHIQYGQKSQEMFYFRPLVEYLEK